jgi:hypothetical protein
MRDSLAGHPDFRRNRGDLTRHCPGRLACTTPTLSSAPIARQSHQGQARIETPHPDWTALLLRPVRSACGKHLFVPNFILVSDARVHQVEYFSLIGHPFIMGDPTVSIGVNLSRQFRAI